MPDIPLVSIIIPTYNRKQYVTDAIDSALGQTYPNCEVIVVDDGSSDNTEAVLLSTYGNRIRFFKQVNQGPGIARNTGIAHAQGEFVHFCDADDQLLPEKIEKCVSLLRNQPDIAVVHTHYQFVAPDGKSPLDTPPLPQFTDNLFCELLRLTGNHILVSSTMVRKSALDDVGGFPNDIEHRSAEDWDLFLRLSEKYQFAAINEKLVLRRMHPNMMSDDRYYGALGRLKTIQRARKLDWNRCLSTDDFDRIEAARYFMLGMSFWKSNNREEARKAIQSAIMLYPRFANRRRMYLLFTYFLPAESVDWTMTFIDKVKQVAVKK